MQEKLDSFILQIPDLESQSSARMIEYFVYFLTIIEKQSHTKASEIANCFDLTKLTKYSNIASYLSRCSKKKRGSNPKFLKGKQGYTLERNAQLEIQKTLHAGPAKVETSHLLRGLLSKLTSKSEQSFLQEAIDCYEIGARRASTILVWNLTIFHVYQYIFKNEQAKFNAVLSKNTDKRIKIKSISKIDDFTEIPEGKFIEFTRSAKIITNDVRKILDTKLGIRNTYAHPSSVSISEVKATDFIIDLVDNVITKYKI